MSKSNRNAMSTLSAAGHGPRPGLLLCALIAAVSSISLTSLSAQAPEVSTTAPASDKASVVQKATSRPMVNGLLVWQTNYTEALTEAHREGRPVLVRVGAKWCSWCMHLDREIETTTIQEELRRWTLIYIDADKPPKQINSLAVEGLPALRVLSPSGRLMASQNGYLDAAALNSWLKGKYLSVIGPTRTSKKELKDAAAVTDRLIEDLSRRDPAVREFAIRRLILSPKHAGKPVVEALTNGALATRLGALEVLQEWAAPVEGMDPWQPETIEPDRLEALRQWVAEASPAAPDRSKELTASQMTSARREIEKLLSEETPVAEVDAICERLSRYGSALMPEVYQALRKTTQDVIRERLIGLRYRLVAGDELVFSWPGGLQRLAAMDVQTRHRAAEELARRATPAEEPLLLELFSDPDGMVREISLRTLNKIGGQKANSALVGLLQDPEPNVRAAVLKQLAETPSDSLVPKLAEYVGGEKDADLIVHAIRVLRATKGSASAECLLTLITHVEWQIRAEMAEALGEKLSNESSLATKTKKKITSALVTLLSDSDGFVASVAVKGLKNSDLSEAVDALAATADRHPELAQEVLDILADKSELRSKSVNHIRRFCTHDNPMVRAVAIEALCTAVQAKAQKELAAALNDDSSRVRIAAARALFKIIQSKEQTSTKTRVSVSTPTVHIEVNSSEAGIVTQILRGFLSGRAPKDSAVASRPGDESISPASSPAATTLPATVAQASAPAATTSTQEVSISASASPATSSAPATASAPTTASAQATEVVSASERWLARYRSGETRPAWMNELVPSIEKMLTAESADERMAAAIVLVPFGRDEQVMPVLLAGIRLRPDSIDTLAGVLPWLPWSQRLEFYQALIAARPRAQSLQEIIQGISKRSDPRVAALLWEILADKNLDARVADGILDTLRRTYFGDSWHRPSDAPLERRRQAKRDSLEHIRGGTERQRIAGLALLLGLSAKEAAAEAGAIVTDTALPAQVRQDALRIQLLGDTPSNSQKRAVALLMDEDDVLRRVAAGYLTDGEDAQRRIWDGVSYLYYEGASRGNYSYSGESIKVTAPAGLTVEAVKPLLEAEDGRLAAQAGYLLATLKDSSGLDVLLNYWRTRSQDTAAFRRLVYRAIAALNDDNQVPILEEIYRTYGREDYELREFYWTIRGMTGTNAGKLRKQIRDEVGMDRLR